MRDVNGINDDGGDEMSFNGSIGLNDNEIEEEEDFMYALM